MPFFRWQFFFFPFQTLSSCKKIIVRSMCEETDAMLIVFSDLNIAGVYFDLWVCEAL